MIPPDGSHVKCILKNNVIAEGIVEEWYGNIVKLKSLDGKSYLIIHHPGEDIVLTKVMVEEISKDSSKNQAEIIADKIRAKQVEKEPEPIDQMALDAKSKAELHVELAKQEREEVAAKLRDHHIGEVKRVQYGQPGFYKKPSIK